MRVICLWYGTKYSQDYVHRLEAACSRHLPAHDFICMTDGGIDTTGYQGWWHKIGLLQPGKFPGDNLYLDLDVVITGSLQPFLDAFETDPTKLWMLNDFSYKLDPYLVDGQPAPVSAEVHGWLGGPGSSTANSSVMMWRDDAARMVWDDFQPAMMSEYHGDQNWITRCMWPNFRVFPAGLARSYKYGGEGPITIFHGSPKPHEVSDQFVRDHWI